VGQPGVTAAEAGVTAAEAGVTAAEAGVTAAEAVVVGQPGVGPPLLRCVRHIADTPSSHPQGWFHTANRTWSTPLAPAGR